MIFWLLPAPQASATRWVEDEARTLPDPVETALEADLEQLFQRTGVGLHMKAVTFLSTDLELRDAARTLRRTYQTSDFVGLLLFERSRDAMVLSLSPDLWQRYPVAEMHQMASDAMAQARGADLTLEERITRVMHFMVLELQRLERGRQTRGDWRDPAQWRLSLGYAGVLVAVGVLVGTWMASRRRREQSEVIQWRFPEVEVAMRLGAPFGGGVMASHLPGTAGEALEASPAASEAEPEPLEEAPPTGKEAT